MGWGLVRGAFQYAAQPHALPLIEVTSVVDAPRTVCLLLAWFVGGVLACSPGPACTASCPWTSGA